jgi:hypothetical protein
MSQVYFFKRKKLTIFVVNDKISPFEKKIKMLENLYHHELSSFSKLEGFFDVINGEIKRGIR